MTGYTQLIDTMAGIATQAGAAADMPTNYGHDPAWYRRLQADRHERIRAEDAERTREIEDLRAAWELDRG